MRSSADPFLTTTGLVSRARAREGSGSRRPGAYATGPRAVAAREGAGVPVRRIGDPGADVARAASIAALVDESAASRAKTRDAKPPTTRPGLPDDLH